MKLLLCRSATEFAQTLTANKADYCAVFGRSLLPAAELSALDQASATSQCRDLSADREIQTAAALDFKQFLDTAALDDPDWRYACSSKVALAIPDFNDLLLVFSLRALEKARPNSSCAALVTAAAMAQLVRSQFEPDSDAPQFPALSRRTLIRAARSALRAMFAQPPHVSPVALIFTLGNVGNAPDAYFGPLADALRSQATAVTVYLAAGSQIRFNHNPHAVPLEAFLRVTDVFSALKTAMGGATPAAHLPDPRDRSLAAYLRGRERAAGDLLQQEIMKRAFPRMIRALRPEALVYPFENRSWEKQLLRAARGGNVKRCIAYQHSSLNARHWALQAGMRVYARDDLPDQVSTCGEVTAQRLAHDMPQLSGHIQVGVALRSTRLALKAPGQAGVLVAISSNRSEARALIHVTHAAAQKVNVPFIIRSHPTIPVDDLFGELSWPAHVELSQGRTLAHDLERCSHVAYSSATVALEGMLYGRLPIFVDIGDVPSADPLEGEHIFRGCARNGNELADVIRQSIERPGAEIESLRRAAQVYAERYLMEPTADRVNAIARMIATC